MTTTIKITPSGFDPQTVEIDSSYRQTAPAVEWVWPADGRPHSVTSGLFDSGVVRGPYTFSWLPDDGVSLVGGRFEYLDQATAHQGVISMKPFQGNG